jgi:2-amino-4-hydroxy-6-hydroxymethyldihydropteridine diphosphokinase
MGRVSRQKLAEQAQLYESVIVKSSDMGPVLIALGANLPIGDRTPAETLRAALALLATEGVAVLRCSPLYQTPCFPAGAGPDYVNAAAVVQPAPGMGAAEVLAALHRVEAAFGRERAQRWGMRTLDLDLVAMGQTVLPDPAEAARWRDLPPDLQARAVPDRLILPHPRLQDRAFVLVPLADVAPQWRHPALGLTVAQMLAALPQADRDAIRPMADA